MAVAPVDEQCASTERDRCCGRDPFVLAEKIAVLAGLGDAARVADAIVA